MSRPPRRGRSLRASLLVVCASLAGAPGSARADDRVPEDAVLAALPFLDVPEPNRIVVDLAPEGRRPFPLLLDTGASDSVITPRLARELGVPVRRAKDSPYRRPTKLGRDLAFRVDVASSDTGSRTGWEVGVLGGNFLEAYVVELDFSARRVRLLDPERYAVEEQANAPAEAVLRLGLAGRRPSIDAGVGAETASLLLDTGAPGTFVLSGELARRAGVSSRRVPGLDRAGTTLGPVDVELADAVRLSIGSFVLEGVPGFVAPKGLYNQAGATDSVIGVDVLSRFLVRIDYPRRRIWLRRREGAPITLYGADWARARESGALAVPLPKGASVWALLPDSAAERFGLRPGDSVPRRRGETDAALTERLHGAIVRGDALDVVRPLNGIGIDVSLPEEPSDADGEDAAEGDASD